MKEFEMTDEQRARILDASRPVPYIVVGGIEPRSPQENANDAWRELGRELGFDYMTVRPVAGKSDRFFLAEPTEPAKPEAPLTMETSEGWKGSDG